MIVSPLTRGRDHFTSGCGPLCVAVCKTRKRNAIDPSPLTHHSLLTYSPLTYSTTHQSLLLPFDKLIRISFKRAAWRRTPENVLLDLLGQGKVFIGDAPGGMSHELDPKLGVADGQVGVVVGRLADVADGIGQQQSDRPAAGGVFAPQPAVFHVPFVETQLFELGFDLIVRVDLFLFSGHGSATFLVENQKGQSQEDILFAPRPSAQVP